MPGFLTEKAGPFPVWGWMAGASAVILVFLYEKKKKASASSPQAAAQTPITIPYAANISYGNGVSSGPRMSRNNNSINPTPAPPPATTTTGPPTTTPSSGGTGGSTSGGTVINPITGQPFPAASTWGQQWTDSAGNIWQVATSASNAAGGPTGNYAWWQQVGNKGGPFMGGGYSVDLPVGSQIQLGQNSKAQSGLLTTTTTQAVANQSFNAQLNANNAAGNAALNGLSPQQAATMNWNSVNASGAPGQASLSTILNPLGTHPATPVKSTPRVPAKR